MCRDGRKTMLRKIIKCDILIQTAIDFLLTTRYQPNNLEGLNKVRMWVMNQEGHGSTWPDHVIRASINIYVGRMKDCAGNLSGCRIYSVIN